MSNELVSISDPVINIAHFNCPTCSCPTMTSLHNKENEVASLGSAMIGIRFQERKVKDKVEQMTLQERKIDIFVRLAELGFTLDEDGWIVRG